MNIVVLMKQVPDTEASIRPDAAKKAIVETDIKFVVNPYDEFAVEEAIKIKEARSAGTVTVVTLGPARADEALRTCIAMGADEAVRLDDEGVELDARGAASLLAKVISELPCDLLLAGKQAIDDDLGAVSTLVAVQLGLPHVSVVTELDIAEDGRSALCRKEIDGGTQRVEVQLPAVVTAQKGLNEPRYPALRGLMMAKKKEIRVIDANSLGVSPEQLAPAYTVTGLSAPPAREKGKILEGEPAQTAAELVKLLKDEAKVI